jgi:sugar transferase (PEP-CTERM/EpsH1 system associated)
MPELLFLTQRIPYPPIKGEKIRPLQILKFLRQHYDVHLGCLVDDPRDWEHVPVLQELCGETHFAPLHPRLAKLTCLRGLLTGEPLSTAYFYDRGLARWVADLLDRRRPELAFICSSAMAPYVLRRPNPPPRIVMDFADVDADKWRQYAARHGLPMRWVYARESRVLLAFDREIGRKVDAVTFVSEAEATLFSSLAPELARKTHYVDSGVDAAYFCPSQNLADPFRGAEPVVVFAGTMNYWPNVDAVSWFATEVLPRARAQVPNLRFYIVGANPDAAVQALAELPGVSVTGRVDDVRPYLAHAAAVVAPLRAAGGVQNKVLEGMAMAKTVVATPRAVAGLRPEAARWVVVADGAAAFAAAVTRAVGGGTASSFGASARRIVLDLYNWERNLSRFLPLLGQPAQGPALSSPKP